MAKVFVTMGIPGSGKSYAVERLFGEAPNLVIINPDSIRGELTGDESEQTRNDEVFSVAHSQFCEALTNPEIEWVVFDATNVKKYARENILAICQEFGAPAALLIFDIEFDICAARNEARERTVPQRAMVRMQLEFEQAISDIQSERWERVAHVVSANEQGVQLLSFE